MSAYIVAMLTEPMLTIPFLLHDVARQIRYAFDARARSVGVTRPQYRVLLYLARHDGPSQSEIADALDVERITLGRMIDRMEEARLVERRADPGDRRVWRLHMLPAAQGLVDRLATIGAEVEAEALSHLAAADRDRLKRLLTAMNDGMRATRGERGRVAA